MARIETGASQRRFELAGRSVRYVDSPSYRTPGHTCPGTRRTSRAGSTSLGARSLRRNARSPNFVVLATLALPLSGWV